MSSRLPPALARAAEDVKRAATAKGRAASGLFVAEGRRLLERAWRAGVSPRQILLDDGAELDALERDAASRGSSVIRAPREFLLELCEGRQSGLVTALFEIPPHRPLDELLAAELAPSLYLVLVGVDEPGNVGALIRTALASGARAALCVGSSDPFHPKAVRTSLGSVFKLAVARSESCDAAFGELRRAGVFVLAAVAREGEPLDRAVWPRGSVALAVGNEARGLPASARDLADGKISIDLSREADSYSVNAAAAVCLYEVQRRLRMPSG